MAAGVVFASRNGTRASEMFCLNALSSRKALTTCAKIGCAICV